MACLKLGSPLHRPPLPTADRSLDFAKKASEKGLYRSGWENYARPLSLILIEEQTMEKGKMIAGYRLHERDTGSADVQIALLTDRINHLTEHLQKNVKDHSSRRGLLMMVGQRRRLLDYLHNINLSRYQTVTKKLKLRH